MTFLPGIGGGSGGGGGGGPIDSAGALAFYRFDGDLLAEVGTDLTLDTGTERYAPANVADRLAMSFDALTRIHQAAQVPALAITGALTVQMLVRPLDRHTGTGVLVNFGQGGGSDTEDKNLLWGIDLTENNTLRYIHEHLGGLNDEWITDVDIPTGEWSLVTLWREANGLDLAIGVNGIERGSFTLNNAPTGGTIARLNLGAFAGVAPPTNANTFQCADLRIDDSRRSEAQALIDAQVALPGYLRP